MIKWRLREKVIGSLTTRSCRSEKEIPSNDERRDSIVSSNEKQKSHLSARLLHLGNWTQYKNHFITSGHCHAIERPCNTRRNTQVVGWDILYSLRASSVEFGSNLKVEFPWIQMLWMAYVVAQAKITESGITSSARWSHQIDPECRIHWGRMPSNGLFI